MGRRPGLAARWLRRRPVLSAAALYAVLAIAFFAQALQPGRVLSGSDYLWSAAPWISSTPDGVRGFGANTEQADSVVQFQPFLQYTRDALPDVPLWNPHVMGGRPFVANAQSAVFSPFSVPAYVLPFWRSLAIVAMLKVFVAAFGTFVLGRALGMRFPGAFVAGLVFGFGLFFVIWLPWPLASVWAWIPWLLLATEALVRRPGPLPAAGLAAVVAVQFAGGHPESSFHALFAALAFLALRLVQRRRAERGPWSAALRPTVLWTAALAGGAALAAVAVVPFVELLAASGDVTRRGDEDPAKVSAEYLVSVLMPEYYGRPTGNPFKGFIVERAFYVGALPLFLAGAAVMFRPTLERVAIAVFGALAVAVTVGAEPFFWLANHLPGFSSVHNSRLPILFLLCMALLAGWGLDDLVERRPARRRAAALLAGAGALLVAPIAMMAVRGRLDAGRLDDALQVAWGFVTPPAGRSVATIATIQQAGLIVWLTLGGIALALLALRIGGRLAPGAFAVVAVAFVVVDLFRIGVGQNPAIPREHATQPATGAVRYLEARRPARFAGLSPEMGIPPFPPNVAMRYDLYDARGYDYPVERRYDRIWRRYVAPMPGFAPPTTLASAEQSSLRVLSLFGVTDVLQQRADPPVSAPGLRLAYDAPDARIYRNERAVPRAVVVATQRVVDGEDAALDAIGSPGFDPRREAVVEEPVRGLVHAGRAGAGAPAGDARIVSYGRERVTVRARASRRALVVLSDVHFPGWKATVDGRDAPIERVDYLFRGVAIDAGAHTVELRYEPASWRVAWIVSAVALAGLAATLALGLRRRRVER